MKIGFAMSLNKIIKILSIGVLTLSTLAPTTSFAKWTFGDQVNLANRTLNGKVDELKNQLKNGSSQQGFYMFIPFRSNDPFIFCTEGPNTPGVDYYWVPTDRIGGYVITNYYAYMWNPPSWISTAYYTTVCPHGAGPGRWTGPGTGAEVPFLH